MEPVEMSFDKMFCKATNRNPFPYQTRFAEAERLPELIEVPTGAGKTAAAMLGWVWRRRYAPESIRRATPRRLVYCLPMRVLVEQTRDCAVLWLHNLGLLAGEVRVVTQNGRTDSAQYEPSWGNPDRIAVSVLMGGEERRDWDLWPESEAIIIGTQDMLLSRALNRGYGMSRYRWPMHFALLNNDSLWIFDEIQLMGSGLATATQLAAFRDKLKAFGPSLCLWMSATLRRDWLETIDFRDKATGLSSCQLAQDDHSHEDLRQRLNASKQLQACPFDAGETKDKLAQFVVSEHQASSLTLVVVNTVERATGLFKEIMAKCQARKSPPEVLLLHSRFRPHDRQKIIKKLLAQPSPIGLIAVSTQVVEAGVDISARTLFTELAPWPPLVQRFGRCNRYGEYQDAKVYWMDIPKPKRKSDNEAALPYEREQLETARKHVAQLPQVGPRSLQQYMSDLTEEDLKPLFPYYPRHVVRRKDIVELFDTMPDLAGNDIDVSRFIRDGEELDVQVFWRDVAKGQRPSPDDSSGKAVRREELCSVSFIKFREFLDRKNLAYRWDYLERQWARAVSNAVFPGQVYLVPCDQGGYLPDLGWQADSNDCVDALPGYEYSPDHNDDDQDAAHGSWQTIAEHTQDVLAEMKAILPALGLPDDVNGQVDALVCAVLWHDRGKAHPVFQGAIPDSPPRPDQWAKASERFKSYRRRFDIMNNEGMSAKGFRHELASALAMLQAGKLDLACYLAAAHHGKVRLSIRSLPHEPRPSDPTRRFARGIWDGDQLPSTDLGGTTAPEVTLSLDPMELGLSDDGKPSWMERMLVLRDALGPFRLAFLEALLRAADMRASADRIEPQEEHHA